MSRSIVVAAFAATMVACSASEDGGVPTTGDSGVADGSARDSGVDASTTPADVGIGTMGAGEAIAAGAGESLADAAEDPSGRLAGDPSSCWDGMDNDGDFERDCDDPACDAAPACGLGSGTRCAPDLDVSFVASSCATGPATGSCLGIDGSVFGSPAPWVADGRLHPGGDDFDSGFVSSETLEPRTRRVVMTGTFGEPTCPGPTTCLEVASFGITTTTTFDATTRVRPTAVLQLSGARFEVALLVGGSTIERWAFDPASPEWTLDLRPTGELVVRNGPDALLRTPYAPPSTATAVIYGRNANRAEDEPGGAGLESFGLETELCDVPDAWESRAPIVVVDASGTTLNASTIRAPSARRGGDGVLYLAFEVATASGQGRIMVAAEDGSATRFALRHPPDSEILAASDVDMEVTRVGDPEIYWDGATWHLFFTGDLGGERRIGHASGADLTMLSFTGWVVTPPENAAAVDEPSVTRSADGRWILAVGTSIAGGRAIGIYVGAGPEGPFVRHGGSLEMQTYRTGGGRSGFDADEVGAPSIRVVEGAYHLYFAGRRGTRWGVGVWTSAELVYWRPVTRETPILGGDGNGFDALGVRDPELLVEGETARLFYLGDDGESTSVAVAARPQPMFAP